MAMRSIRGTRQLWAAAVLALAGGCYDPQLVDPGLFLCPDQRCPEGFACNAQQRCVRVAADGGADQRTGRRADGGGDGGTSRAALSCSAEDPLPVTQVNESAIGMIGLVSDESGALAVSYPAAIFEGNSERGSELALARRRASAVGEAPALAPWTRLGLAELNALAQGAPVFSSAVDTRTGKLAVAFNNRKSASGAEQAPLTLWAGPSNATSGGSGTLTDLTAGWTGGPLLTGAAPAVVLVQGSDGRGYAVVAGQGRPDASNSTPSSVLAVVDVATGVRKATLQVPPAAPSGSDKQVVASGLAQRLLVNGTVTPPQLLIAQLGELIPRVGPLPTGTLPPTLITVSQLGLDTLLKGQQTSPTVAWSSEPQVSVRGFGALPLAVSARGASIVFPLRGPAPGLFAQSIPPQPTLQAIRPGDAIAATAIRPAVASRDDVTGVAYLAFAGALDVPGEAAATSTFGQICFTAATKQQEGQWTKALCLPGTAGDSGAYQVEVVASQVTPQRAVFELVYLQRQPIAGVVRLRISHSRVVCKSQL